MAYSEARRKANDKWLENNYKTITFRVPIELADRFKVVCKALNQSQAKVFKKAMEDYLKENGNGKTEESI